MKIMNIPKWLAEMHPFEATMYILVILNAAIFAWAQYDAFRMERDFRKWMNPPRDAAKTWKWPFHRPSARSDKQCLTSQYANPPDKLPATDNDTVRAYNLLGGEQVMRRSVQDEIAAHDLIIAGFSTHMILHLAANMHTPGLESDLAKTIGVSIRALQGALPDVGDAVLSPDQSSRAWQLSKTVVQATDLLGSQEAAELWLLAPAMGLDNRRPIDLLATSAGAEAVGDLLIRLDYGVYA